MYFSWSYEVLKNLLAEFIKLGDWGTTRLEYCYN
jgi:hypothetical protein